MSEITAVSAGGEGTAEVLAPVEIAGQQEIVNGWLQWLDDQVAQGLRAPLTAAKYRQVIRYWLTYLETHERTDRPTPGSVDRYQMGLHARVRPSSCNLYLEAVRSCYAWAERKERYPNIARSMEVIRIRRDKPLPAFTEIEVQRLLDAIHGDDLPAQRNRILIALLFGTAIRGGSLVECNVGDFRPDLRTLSFRTKGSRDSSSERRIPDHTAQRLGEYLVARNASGREGPLSPEHPLVVAMDRAHWGHRLTTSGLRRILEGVIDQAEITSGARGVHALRRAALVLTADAFGIEAAQLTAGHASAATTRAAYAAVKQGEMMGRVAERLNSLQF